jgi:cytosine/adenosine deaminase-related metal-dependent hydrolase
MSESLLVGGWVVTGVDDRKNANVLRDAAVVHRDGVVVEVGPSATMRRKYPLASVEGSADHAILPGFVNSHHHVGMTPLQLGTPDYPLELWLPNRLSARAVDLYLDTLYSAFEMIASGVTTVQHLLGGLPKGPQEQFHNISTKVLKAYRAVGMRASYSFMVRDQNKLVYEADAQFLKRLPAETAKVLAAFLATTEVPFEDFLTLFDMLNRENEGQNLTRIQLSPSNLQWCSDDALLALKQKSDRAGVPMHMHLLETAYQKEYAHRRTGTTAVKHLDKLGLLGPSMTLGHGVWLTEEDIEIVAATGTCLCHNCSSNFRLRSGLAPLNMYESKGITMGVGLDEAGINDDRDMLQEMRMVLRAHRVPGLREDEVPTCPQVLRMATEHGAMTTAFGATIGKLESGRFADVVMINVKRAFYPYQDDDVPMVDALLQRAKTDSVDAVFVNGDKIYENGKFTRVDRDKVLAELAEALSQPRTEAENYGRELRRLVIPHVEAFYRDYLVDTKSRKPFYATSSRI